MKLVMKALPAALLLASASGVAFGAGFQLLEQNASSQGTSYAGTAAQVDNASTVFSNPAGMALLPQGKMNFSASLSAIKPSAKFSDQGSTSPTATLTPLGLTALPVGNNGGDAGDWAFLPSAYFTMPINKDLTFGIGLNAPFGLKTEYNSDWAGRFQGIKSDVKTINLNPSLSFKVNDKFAVGFGLNYQQLKGEFTSAVNYEGAVFAAARAAGQTVPASVAFGNAAGEGFGKLNGTDTTWGYNFGFVFDVSPSTRIGASYRSAMKYHLTGTADFSRTASAVVNTVFLGAATSTVRGGDIYADIKLPDTLTLSAITHINDKWDLLGDLAWTGWAKIPDLTFKYANNDQVVSSTQENWRNTLRVAVGATYRYNDTWTSRFGIAYDQTPVPDSNRTVRLPDNNRTWISFGGQYRVNKDAALDFGYSHLFVKEGPMNSLGGTTSGNLLGNYDNSVDILSVQYSVAF